MKNLAPWTLILLCIAALIRPALADPPPEGNAVTLAVATETATPEPVAGRTAQIDNMLMHALSLIGVKYRAGGSRRDDGFDCSGFVRYVFAEALSMELPRSSFAMSKLGSPVDADALLPGDLLFYNTLKRRYSHVGIYLGEGRFVHALSRGKRVEIVEMGDRYWTRRFDGARRLVDQD